MFKNLTLCTALALGISVGAAAQAPQAAMPSQLADQNLLTDITNVNGRLIAVGERGHIIYSDDGQSWQQAQVPVNVLLTAVAFTDQNHGFAVGHDATLLKTEDAGVSWQIVNYQPEIDKPLLNIAAVGQQVIAVGAYGLYWSSADGGKTWQDDFQDELLLEDDRLYLEDLKQFEPETYNEEKQFMLPHFNDVAAVDGELIMVGEAGFMAKSADLGENWQQMEADYFGSYFSVVDTPEGVQIGGLRGNLFDSKDRGDTWHNLPTPVAATINDSLVTGDSVYHFANSGNVFYSVKGQPVEVYTFADGKAVMSGVEKDGKLYFATEAGIKSLPINQLTATE